MSGWFSLEAVYAKKGDALILHYGSKTSPRWLLIDGGHKGVYEEFLRPRLDELRMRFPGRLDSQNKLPLEMVMVSHADEDHLLGVLDLTAEMSNGDPTAAGPPVSIKKIWFNGFSDLIARDPVPASVEDSLARAASTGLDSRDAGGDARAVIASTAQGRQLRLDAAKLAIPLNSEYGNKLVMRGPGLPKVTSHGGGLKFTLIAPEKTRIDKLRAKWKSDLKKILKKEKEAADTASFSDSSPFNLSSIIVLAKRGGRTMLLTGDARGDDLFKGLDEAGLLDASKKIHVDLFKLPHHGSDRNVKKETFRDITAAHYVISANGEHDNPDPAALTMLVEGRKLTRSDPYTMHFTFPDEAFRQITEAQANKKAKLRKQKDALKAIDDWVKQNKPANCTMRFRARNERSLAVDLDTEKV